jgi:DNA invertase Pin-like site-specific DNA recombinase
MEIGYARTSTTDQVAGFEAQKKELTASGCTKVFSEQTSSLSKRAQLEAAIDYLRDGDKLVVTKLDRLARSIRDLLSIVDQINAKGASLQILTMQLDTSTAAGRMQLGLFGLIAEFEREIMLERQREGIAKAKAEGKYRGRAKTAKAKSRDVEAMLKAGDAPTEVAKKLGIGRSSVYRIMGELGIRRRMASTE